MTDSRRTLGIFVDLVSVPILLYLSLRYQKENSYLFWCTLVILLSIASFMFLFDRKKIRTREIMIIAVMSTLAVLGRVFLFFAPEVKIMSAIVVISGMTLGPVCGFLVGAVSAFTSNFFFGQGSWTVWQMYALGMVGLLSGIMLKNRRGKLTVSITGFLLVFLVYGFIVNFHSLLFFSGNVSLESAKLIYIPAVPFDLMHGFTTFVFLWFFEETFYQKIERVKMKYGITDLN